MTTEGPTSPGKFMYHNGYNRWEAYGIPGRPFLTGGIIADGAELKVEFPTITRNIVVMASGSGDLRVHFDTSVGTNVISQHHYVTLSDAAANPEGGRMDFPVRVKEIYISNASGGATGFELVGYCAAVAKNDVVSLSGSGINSF
tara:strand:- start:135 stop:566 length:432 start_codon:yes stop_codon:yes gene_type:complete